MNSELLKEINAAPRVALGSLLETVDVRGGTVDHNEIEGVNINGSSCIVVGKKIKQLHWKAVV